VKVIARVPSLSQLGKSYAIRQLPSGLSCDCPAFDYSKDHSCKHTAIYKAAEHARRRCFDAHGWREILPVTPDARPDWLTMPNSHGLCPQCVVDLTAAFASKVRRRYVAKEVVAQVREKARAKVLSIRAKRKKR
jgi:hypothetical protein